MENKTSAAVDLIADAFIDVERGLRHSATLMELMDRVLAVCERSKKMEVALGYASQIVRDPDEPQPMMTTLEYRPPKTSVERLQEQIEELQRRKFIAQTIQEALAFDPLA